MTKVILAVMCCLLILSISAFKVATNRIEVVFSRKTSFDQLAKLKSDLHKKHIELTFNKLEFDGNGLTKIDFKVDCGDGFNGSASSDRLTNTSRFGFFRDYAKGAKSPFGTGAIN